MPTPSGPNLGKGVEYEGSIELAHSPLKASWGQQGKQHRGRAALITSAWKGLSIPGGVGMNNRY